MDDKTKPAKKASNIINDASANGGALSWTQNQLTMNEGQNPMPMLYSFSTMAHGAGDGHGMMLASLLPLLLPPPNINDQQERAPNATDVQVTAGTIPVPLSHDKFHQSNVKEAAEPKNGKDRWNINETIVNGTKIQNGGRNATTTEQESTTSKHLTTSNAPTNGNGNVTLQCMPTYSVASVVNKGRQSRPAQQKRVSVSSQPTVQELIPLYDLQIFNLMDAKNVTFCTIWCNQFSRNVMTVLSALQVFVLAGEVTSSCPYSQFLRDSCQQLLPGDNQLLLDCTTTGLCCAACLQKQSWNERDFIQLIDFYNEEDMYGAIMRLYKHIISCPFARAKSKVLKKRTFSIENQSDLLALRAFAHWFCEYIHEDNLIDKGIQVPVPSVRQREFAADAISRYIKFQEATDCAYEDLESAFLHRMNIDEGLLASDLTDIPSEDSLTEFPFYLLLLEHIEIVRVTREKAGHLEGLFNHEGMDSLVLFQCKCCHGTSCLEDSAVASTVKRPYVVYRDSHSQRPRLVCELIELAFHHFQACSKVSMKSKLRLRRVAPSPTSLDFDAFACYFQERVAEWVEYIKTRMNIISMSENVAPCEDVLMWYPINDLIEGGDSMRSTYAIPTRKHNVPCLASDTTDNDVLEGFDDAADYIGNRRFRKLVGSLRDSFLSTTNPVEREDVTAKVFRKIAEKGGRFRRLDSDGVWRQLSRYEAAERCREALEKGFVGLLSPCCSRRRNGPGANVLETEIAPHYDLLSGRKRGSIVTKFLDNGKEREIRRRRIRPGANVLETDMAPHCDLLDHDEETEIRKRQWLDSKCRAVADI